MSIEMNVFNSARRFGEASHYVFVWTFSPVLRQWRPIALTQDAIEEAAEFAAKHSEDCPPKPSRFARVMHALFGA